MNMKCSRLMLSGQSGIGRTLSLGVAYIRTALAVSVSFN